MAQNKSHTSEFVRESNTMRLMTSRQVWVLMGLGAIFLAVLLIVGLV